MEAALTALLASVAGGRRYWGRAPQTEDTYPFLVLNIISRPGDYIYSGDSGYRQTRVQVDIYAETFTSVRDTRNAVVTALSGFSGTQSGTLIQGAFIDSERDLQAADAGDVSHLYRRSIDFLISHD